MKPGNFGGKPWTSPFAMTALQASYWASILASWFSSSLACLAHEWQSPLILFNLNSGTHTSITSQQNRVWPWHHLTVGIVLLDVPNKCPDLPRFLNHWVQELLHLKLHLQRIRKYNVRLSQSMFGRNFYIGRITGGHIWWKDIHSIYIYIHILYIVLYRPASCGWDSPGLPTGWAFSAASRALSASRRSKASAEMVGFWAAFRVRLVRYEAPNFEK